MIEMQVTTTNASLMCYIWRSPGEVTRPLLVALHGGGFNAGYFDGANSLVYAAQKAGFDVVLFDRPGYGKSRFCHRAGDILQDNAQVLSEAIAAIIKDTPATKRTVYLLGHSIGGAIALLIGAMQPSWLTGITVSGIGTEPPEALKAMLASQADRQPEMMSRQIMEFLFFAPQAATPAAVDGLMAAAEPAISEELKAIYTSWPDVTAETLRHIQVPTQIILAEHESLWKTGPEVMAQLRDLLVLAPRVDVDMFANVGHCIEAHPQASAFYSRIFKFLQFAL